MIIPNGISLVSVFSLLREKITYAVALRSFQPDLDLLATEHKNPSGFVVRKALEVCSVPVLVLFILFPAGSENTGSANLGISGPFPGRQIRKGNKEEELTRVRGRGIGPKSAEKV